MVKEAQIYGTQGLFYPIGVFSGSGSVHPSPTDLIAIGVAVRAGGLRILWLVYLSTIRAFRSAGLDACHASWRVPDLRCSR